MITWLINGRNQATETRTKTNGNGSSDIAMIRTLLSFLVVFSGALPAIADVTVLEDRIEWYDVTGATLNEVRQSLRERSPAKPYDAEAKWWIDWRYRWMNDATACRLTQVTVMLRVVTTFPRLAPDAPAPADLRRSWQSYSDRLMVHERGHARIGADAAEQIDQRLKTISIEGNCDNMEATANEAAMELIRQANQADKDYDRRTNHGATQGASLK